MCSGPIYADPLSIADSGPSVTIPSTAFTDGRTSYYVFISYILCKHYWDFKIRYAEVSKASRPNDIFMQRLVRKTMQGIDRSKRGCEDNIKMVLKSRRR